MLRSALLLVLVPVLVLMSALVVLDIDKGTARVLEVVVEAGGLCVS